MDIEERNLRLARTLAVECISILLGRELSKHELAIFGSTRTKDILINLNIKFKSTSKEDREYVLAVALEGMRLTEG